MEHLGLALITASGPQPDNEETRRMFELIGKSLTRIEVRAGGYLYLEFDPHGSIALSPRFSMDIYTAIAGIPTRTN